MAVLWRFTEATRWLWIVSRMTESTSQAWSNIEKDLL